MNYSKHSKIMICCSKCTGIKVKIRKIGMHVTLFTMEQYVEHVKQSQFICGDSMIRYYQYRLICTECGHTLDFERQGS